MPDDQKKPKHADPLVQRALELFNQDVGGPVRVVAPSDFAALGMDPSAFEAAKEFKAFRLGPLGKRDPEIYVNRESPEYRIGNDPRLAPLSSLALAGALSHELTHDKEQSEYPAYRYEADFLLSKLGTLPAHLQASGKQYWQAIENMAQEEDKKERASRKTAPVDRRALLQLMAQK